MGDQLGGHPKDALRAAVVLLQADDVNLGIVSLEIQHVAEVRPAPAVDRLVRVAGDRQIGIVDRQRPGDGILGQVGVLIFVEQDKAVALVETGTDLGVIAEDRGHVQQEVVEIGGIRGGQLPLIGRVDVADHLAQHMSRPRLILLGLDQVVLGPANGLGQSLGRIAVDVDLEPADRLAQTRTLSLAS